MNNGIQVQPLYDSLQKAGDTLSIRLKAKIPGC